MATATRLTIVGAGTVAGLAWGRSALKRRNAREAVPANTTYPVGDVEKLRGPKRDQMLDRLKKENFDILVIGGGATGAGVALDGATRGLNCALVEAEDFASGTSSRSTKLLHGGVRYLENAFKNLDFGQLSLVWEALEERAHAMKCAPFMAKPVPIVMPVYSYFKIPYVWCGVKMYETLANLATGFDSGVPGSIYISKANALFFFPYLKEKGLKGAFVYYDGQHNDSRMNLHIALTASIPNYIEGFKGAALANHCRVVGFLKDSAGMLVGARVRDSLSGQTFNIKAKKVVNATGPFSDTLRKLATPDCVPLVEPAAGVHVVLPKFYSPEQFGMIIADTSDGRVLFFLPWEDHVVCGTTDQKATLTELPEATEKEVDYILTEAAKYLRVSKETMRRDITATWSGLRPLVRDPKTVGQEGSTAKLSRQHEVVVDKSGLISIMGGKWTTYRRMASDTVNRALELSEGTITPTHPCRTRNLLLFPALPTLPGFTVRDAHISGGVLAQELKRRFNLSSTQAAHLASNYGFAAIRLCETADKEDRALLKPLSGELNFLRAEVVHAVREEMAVRVTDVVGRRMRMAFLNAEGCEASIKEVANIMAGELNWSADRKAAEVANAERFLKTMKVTLPPVVQK